jgi:hypothetical protein
MPDDDLRLVTAEPAAEVCAGRKLSDEARAILTEGLSTRAYLNVLTAAALVADAETVLAHALPKREAVWWACQCVRRAVGGDPEPAVGAALQAAEAWAAAPGDVNRRRAYPAAEAVGFGHPAGSTALAAFLSGGSLAPPNLPAVPPADHLTGDLVASSVQLAALLNDPVRAPDEHRALLEIGMDVARGKSRWKDNL